MFTSKIIFITILISFAIFALYNEYVQYDDAFTFHKASEKDSIVSSLTKLENCLIYDSRTIKWRRILLSTILVIVLLFGLFHQRIPNAKEILIYFFFIYIVFYMNWENYSQRTVSKANLYGRENISNIRRKLSEKHSFILPWNASSSSEIIDSVIPNQE
jgi:hypothetical protein